MANITLWQWHPTPVLLPGKFHGWRNLEGCSPWGCWGSDTTKRLHFHFSLSCIGEGNGNPLQCSCLENPRDRGPWWAAIYGVAQSRTRLKWLSSSSSVCAHACVCVLSSYPFLCWWAFRLIPCLGYCKQCGNEYWGAFILWDHVFLQHILNHLITFRVKLLKVQLPRTEKGLKMALHTLR